MPAISSITKTKAPLNIVSVKCMHTNTLHGDRKTGNGSLWEKLLKTRILIRKNGWNRKWWYVHAVVWRKKKKKTKGLTFFEGVQSRDRQIKWHAGSDWRVGPRIQSQYPWCCTIWWDKTRISNTSEHGGCVKEDGRPWPPTVIVGTVSVDVKQHWRRRRHSQSSAGAL